MSIMSIFGERLNDLIGDNKVLPESLADALNIDLSMIYKYLRKEYIPSTVTAVKLADYFNCSLDYLFGIADEPGNIISIDYKPFSDIFRQLLEDKNCSRYRLRKDTGLARQSIDDWFHGVRIPTIDNLIALSKYFDVSLDYLIGRET